MKVLNSNKVFWSHSRGPTEGVRALGGHFRPHIPCDMPPTILRGPATVIRDTSVYLVLCIGQFDIMMFN